MSGGRLRWASTCLAGRGGGWAGGAGRGGVRGQAAGPEGCGRACVGCAAGRNAPRAALLASSTAGSGPPRATTAAYVSEPPPYTLWSAALIATTRLRTEGGPPDAHHLPQLGQLQPAWLQLNAPPSAPLPLPAPPPDPNRREGVLYAIRTGRMTLKGPALLQPERVSGLIVGMPIFIHNVTNPNETFGWVSAEGPSAPCTNKWCEASSAPLEARRAPHPLPSAPPRGSRTGPCNSRAAPPRGRPRLLSLNSLALPHPVPQPLVTPSAEAPATNCPSW